MTYTVCSLKNYHICNDSGGFKSLTKWGTRSFSAVDCSLAYKEGGAPGARGPLAPPVDRPWNDITRSAYCLFFLDWCNADAKAIRIIKIYDSIRLKNFDCPLKERLWGMCIFCWSGAHNPEWTTSMRLCHDVFTDQFLFRTVLARIYVQFPTHSCVTTFSRTSLFLERLLREF